MRALKVLPDRADDFVSWRLLQGLAAWARRAYLHPPASLLLLAASLYYCNAGLSQQLEFHRLWLPDFAADPAMTAKLTRFSLFTLIAGAVLVLYLVLAAGATVLGALDVKHPPKYTRCGVLILGLGCGALLVALAGLSFATVSALPDIHVQIPPEMIAALLLALLALGATLFAAYRPGRLPKWASLPNLLLAHQVFLLVLAIYYNTEFPIKFADVIR